ncbi:hypothetical protein T492DRAFT_217785 [Pavlovales sp. CCMP2436]|nr:hypothetical protein T492DRAFT_217785 [Pavlovales sp. CCMP2436]
MAEAEAEARRGRRQAVGDAREGMEGLLAGGRAQLAMLEGELAQTIREAHRCAGSDLVDAQRVLAAAHRDALAQDRRALEEGVNEAVGTLQAYSREHALVLAAALGDRVAADEASRLADESASRLVHAREGSSAASESASRLGSSSARLATTHTPHTGQVIEMMIMITYSYSLGR